MLKPIEGAIKVQLLRFENYNKIYMNYEMNHSTPTNLLFQGIKNFLNRLRQNPEVYPIKYYKKGKRFRRNWQAPQVK